MKTKRNITRNTSVHGRKRSGLHQKRSKKFHSVYLPYLPLVAAIILSIFISGWRMPQKGNTLAYATNTSISGLLQATNAQRSANGKASLTINSTLNAAAQAKANDMIARNYWSHNTPDGQEPWVFVENAGYDYIKAGENLAYGFTDSESTITGWMNSPSHKANMLDSAFYEVGFGFANSSNYNASGEQTVVVAMYGEPKTLAATNQTTPTPAAPAETAPQSPAPTPATTTPTAAPDNSATAQPTESIPEKETTTANQTAFTTNQDGLEPVGQQITRAESLTGGNIPWIMAIVTLILGASIVAFLIKHGIGLRRLLKDSENFVLHHPLFDSTVVGLIILAITLSQTVGFIK